MIKALGPTMKGSKCHNNAKQNKIEK